MDFNEHARYVSSHQSPDIEVTEDLKRMVMATCNVRAILESWHVCPQLHNGQWNGYCPDHYLHDGHPQHLPKWYMKASNGDCFCFTSSKSSNFIYVAKRIYGLPTIEATVKALTNGDALVMPSPEFVAEQERNEAEMDAERVAALEKGKAFMRKILDRGHLSDRCIEYFAKDGIERETLDFLGICSIENGTFAGRAMIPFCGSDREICGYVAVNYMGEDWWVKTNYDKMRKIDSNVSVSSVAERYKKTLYCPGFQSRFHLYGLYEVLNGGENVDSLVIVEGERDAIKLLQEGIDCVSIHGTSIKPEQRMMLKRINPDRIYLGFDMDAAGCRATRKAYDILLPEVNHVYVMNFPDMKDPKKFNASEIRSIMEDAEKNTQRNFSFRMEVAENEGKR